MNTSAMQQLLVRTIGSAADSFKLEKLESEKDCDCFELLSQNNHIVIRGSSESAMASGFHWYLKHVCHLHISWCGDRLELPDKWPVIDSIIRQKSVYRYRYNLNYCTYSYSMPFWDWERWERELDWMSLNGINLVLTLTGQEDIWRRTLLRLGYEMNEVADYICGPAFFAWQWMQNLTSWGGPLPLWWYDEQAELARKIRQRMRELGIMPVVQGFSGMVPLDFKSKYPDSSPVNQGLWCGFERPLLLLPSDPMYNPIAAIYYEELYNLYGKDIHYYSIDPFHEGGNVGSVDLSQYAKDVENSLLEHDPNAIWVIQAWEGNPKEELLDAISKDHSLILDLWCESKPLWKETAAFHGRPWIWSMIQNYGGKNGLYGNLRALASEPLKAYRSVAAGQMSGIGLAMEGIGTNPVMYDLLTDVVWREEEPDLEVWLTAYITRRYGCTPSSVRKAWELLEKIVYNMQTVQQGAVESLLCARPARDISRVSSWGPKAMTYDSELVREAVKLLFEGYEECKASDGYLYDLVDVVRQALADLSRDLYEKLMTAYQAADLMEYDKLTDRFLGLLEQQDRLLLTRKEFMLGPWLESARDKARNVEESHLFEYNARLLITLWGPKASASVLRDYSHREWSGLISHFYAPRWSMYLTKVLRQSLLTGEEPIEPDWYSWEYDWVCENDIDYPTEPQGSLRDEVQHIIQEYLS